MTAALRLALALALATAAAAPLRAQDADEAAHRRLAGCYALVPASDEVWLVGLERAIELTLDPVPNAGPTRQRVARAAAGPASGYPHLSWSVFGGTLAQILWSAEEEQVAILFEAAGSAPADGWLGEATFFSHDPDRAAPPVAVRVAPVACPGT